jgi:UDP-N-acetylmuramyl-tripeptide synthetase
MTLDQAILDLLTQSFTTVTADSRQVKKGSLFLAYPGVLQDGRTYIVDAIEKGASAVIWDVQAERDEPFGWLPEWQVKQVGVTDLKQKVGVIAAHFYDNPSVKCDVIGVTGTNGKTTVSQWIAQCLSYLGKKTAVIGTIGNGFVERLETSVNTTPDAILLQKMMADYVAKDASAIAMEVSSHGLVQGRVNEVAFDVAVLTNLTRDHLDYHKTMEAYAEAKRKLFDWPHLKSAILNIDDAFGLTIAQAFIANNKPMLSYGMTEGLTKTHVQGHGLQLNEQSLSMQVNTPMGSAELSANVLGEFNAYNLLAVLATLLTLNVELDKAVEAIRHIKPVVGRMQQFGGGTQPVVVVDYAHTPDALQKVLVSLRAQLTPSGQLSCVFGCGGDRDKGKRALMGEMAVAHADHVIVTSDNPRGEAPEAIVQAVTQDLKKEYRVELDRATAIAHAIKSAKAGDIVLVAGKGHETYQEIKGVKYLFSDADEVKKSLAVVSTKGGR